MSVVQFVAGMERDPARQRTQHPHRHLRRPLSNVQRRIARGRFRTTRSLYDVAIANARPRELPSRAPMRGHRQRQLAVRAAEEHIHLAARTEEVEIDVAETGKGQRYRYIRIDDHSAGDRARPGRIGPLSTGVSVAAFAAFFRYRYPSGVSRSIIAAELYASCCRAEKSPALTSLRSIASTR